MECDHERPANKTILDVLNEDCWRVILDFVHIKDIILSERVSKQWQNVILLYLQGANFSLEGPFLVVGNRNRCRVLQGSIKGYPFVFNQITRKWGTQIKKVVCYNRAGLEVLQANCPNLEHIVFDGINDDVLLNGAHRNFINLRTVHLDRCKNIPDECISKWIGKVSIEGLFFKDADILTGQFLVDLQLTNLRSLSLCKCPALGFQYILSAVDRLTGLKKLELADLSTEIFQNIHSLFDKLPNLEDLCLKRIQFEHELAESISRRIQFGHELAESISRLELKRLNLSYNQLLNDDWLEIIARGCGRLQEFDVERCIHVTARGLGAVCRAASATLRTLRAGSIRNICDGHVEALVAACPDLTLLDLSYGMGITENLVAKVGELTRGRQRLRLMVENTMVGGFHADRYPWLKLDFGDFGWAHDIDDDSPRYGYPPGYPY